MASVAREASLTTFSKEIGSEQIPKSTIAALGKMPGSEGFDNLLFNLHGRFHQDNCTCKCAGTEINRMQRLQQLVCSEMYYTQIAFRKGVLISA